MEDEKSIITIANESTEEEAKMTGAWDRLKDNFAYGIEKVCTRNHLKKAAAVMAVCSVLSAGGVYAHESHDAQTKAERRAAQNQLIMQEVSQRGMTLISEDEAKGIAAKAIGASDESVTFQKVSLKNLAVKLDEEKAELQKHQTKHYKDEAKRARKIADDKADIAELEGAMQTMMKDGSGVQGDGNKVGMFPIYKIECVSGNVEYDVVINAVNGTVIKTEVDD